MIFKQHFIDLILLGEKTQTRRPNKGYYKVGHTYAIQPCRTCKGIPNCRIMIDEIWEEISYNSFIKNSYEKFPNAKLMPVTRMDTNAEGYRTSTSFELAFRELYPNWNGKKRWAYKFHVVRQNYK